MRLKTSDALVKDHPHAFNYVKYVDVGEGWLPLVVTMARIMEMQWQHPETASYSEFVQIKEKFAGLRMYTETRFKTFEEFLVDWKPAKAKAKKEGYLKHREDLNCEASEAYQKYLRQAEHEKYLIRGAEWALEALSNYMCEECGNTVKTKRRSKKGWLKTLCPICNANWNKIRDAKWKDRDFKKIMARIESQKRTHAE